MKSILLSAGLIVLMSNCTSKYNDNIETVLDGVEDKRGDLEAVLEHYVLPTDSLKRKAAYFLVENFPEDQVQTIDKQLMIENIELAFEAWKKPWAKQLNFDEFKELVLPFNLERDSTGTFWRKRFMKEYAFVEDSIKFYPDRPMLLAACIIVDHALRKKYSFEFDRDQTNLLDLNGWERVRKSECSDMAKLTNHIMHSIGIPTAIEFTPQWGNTNYRHFWNVLFLDNKYLPFMGTEHTPALYKVELETEYNFNKKRPKVFRQKYEYNPQSLAYVANEPIPSIFQSTHIVDISKERIPTKSITMPVPDSIDKSYVYLAVSSRTTWLPAAWGKVENEKVTFQDIRKGVMFVPTTFDARKDTLIPFDYPFILKRSGELHQFKPQLNNTEQVTCLKKHPRDETNWIKLGDTYQLYYWDFYKWRLVGTKTATERKVVFDKVPKNSVLLLRNITRGRKERVFVYQDKKQVFL